MNKQTTPETFIISAGTKLQTGTLTKKKIVKPRTKVSGTKKTGVKKEPEKKRKQEMPSSDKISHCFKRRRKDDDRNGDGYQTNITNLTNKQEDKTPEDKVCEKMTVTTEDKNSTNPVSGSDIVKKSFPVGGGDKNTKNDVDDIKCVFGGGRCVTHGVKLSRTVRDKKYSCVDLRGGLEWKTRDVTCLVCPVTAKRTRIIADTENS